MRDCASFARRFENASADPVHVPGNHTAGGDAVSGNPYVEQTAAPSSRRTESEWFVAIHEPVDMVGGRSRRSID